MALGLVGDWALGGAPGWEAKMKQKQEASRVMRGLHFPKCRRSQYPISTVKMGALHSQV